MATESPALDAARAGDAKAFEQLISPFRRELRAHCYRMSGSLSDADDLLQESLIRAWKGLPQFEGRSGLRTWLYKVATSACLDALDKKTSARLLPFDMGPAHDPRAPFGAPRLEPVWLEPCPDDVWADAPVSPEAKYGARESVALAFLAMLQLLPPKQRAVLVLRDVLGWQAAECAELLELSVAAVNSALQRARDTLATRDDARPHAPLGDTETRDLLVRYVRAWELADVPALVSLLHEDATLSMPPLSEWLEGASTIGASIAAMVLTGDARGRFRLVATHANGQPAFAAYERDAATGQFRAYALHVLTIDDDRIASITAFLNPALFSDFGLAPTLA
jgi:RNA polymerase sigma-70 factor (ECF subfamily)